MDITDTLAPKSDQLDAVDLAHTGPQTFTITEVKAGNSEQPVVIHLAEFPRPWKPGKSMRRVLAKGWGVKTNEWPTGARVKLYCDTSVVFGGQKVGGVRILEMSHIDKTLEVPLIISKGKSAVYTVQPLKESAPPADPNAARIAELTAEWHQADDARKAEIQAEVESLRGAK